MWKDTMSWDSQSHQYESNPLAPPSLPSAVDQESAFLQELNECSNLGLTARELVSLAKGNFGFENSAVPCADYTDCDVTSPTERSEYRCHVIPIQPKRKHDILFFFNKKYKLVDSLNELFRFGKVRLSLLKMKPEIHVNGPNSPEIVMKVTSLVQDMSTVKDIRNWLVELGAPPCAGADSDDDDLVVTFVSPNLSSNIIGNESSPASQLAPGSSDRIFGAKNSSETLKCDDSSTGAGKGLKLNPQLTIKSIKNLRAASPAGQEGEATGGIVAAKPKFPLWSKVKVNGLLRQDAALSRNLYNGAFVYINYMYSYGRMTITARDDEDALLKFTQKLQTYAAKANRFRRIPDVNEIVIMPFEGNFHRGRVLSRKGEMVTLDLVDYGDTTSVKFTKLLEINDNIRFEPIYGIIFELVDLPEDLPEISAVEDVTASEGQIEVEEMGLTEWKGKLWLNDDITWDEVILQAAGLM